MARRYFVTVLAGESVALQDLGTQGLDLFQATARATPEGGSAIEGLVTIKEIEKLVGAGYKVLVEEEASKRARARETVEFDQWLRDMEI